MADYFIYREMFLLYLKNIHDSIHYIAPSPIKPKNEKFKKYK